MIPFESWPQGALMAGILGLVWTLGGSVPALAEESEGQCFERSYTINGTLENDLWGSGSDQHFTHGSRLSFVQSKTPVDGPCPDEQRESGGFDSIRNPLNRLLGWNIPLIGKIPTQQISFILGQNIFTPEDTTNPNLIVNDRPYAGWLYFGLGLIKLKEEGGLTYFDTFELDVGIVGPDSYAEDIQIWWHANVSNSPRPEGWRHQLKNEVGFVLNYEKKLRQPWIKNGLLRLQMDFMPSAGFALGTVYTYASAGLMWRLGWNLKSDFGPPRIRPGAQGSDFPPSRKDHQVTFYVYAGGEGRVMGVNIFLDGNTFTESHQVDKKIFVGDAHFGVVLVHHWLRLSFSQVFRSSEFNGQKELSEFGSLSLSVAW
ncbi:MAG: lipid A deacylase LpxR family protein [Nitrospinae bacterium]|nr:lipid A deacylase LpxR family protein [Nitrospinota bacterium]